MLAFELHLYIYSVFVSLRYKPTQLGASSMKKQMMYCVVLLVLPIPCLNDDKKEPVRKRAGWMELVAKRRSTDGIG